jgi:ABC-type transport system involved in multi-copper enzyme maturation permease subunit
LRRPPKLAHRPFLSNWSLLGKELIEQAARRQTYLVRVLYAVLLFGAFGIYYHESLPAMQGDLLGRGSGIFHFLVMAQYVAIFLFLPPLMAGAIAYEKERDSLVLLLLTDLRPRDLILQKYVGRLMPMLTFLMLSLPLLAVAYSLGGVSFASLCAGSIRLFITCLEVGAFTLMCSAYAATTFQALVRSYAIGLLLLSMCGVFLLPNSMDDSQWPFLSVFLTGVPGLVIVGVFLRRAERHLTTRAFVERRNPFSEQFKRMDQFGRDTRKLVRGILWAQDKESYQEAVRVIETSRGRLTRGRRWSLFSFLMGDVEVPGLLATAIIIAGIVGVGLLVVLLMGGDNSRIISVVVTGLWAVALLTVPIQGVNAIASERMNQRLDVLLATPLTGREILDQRTTAIRRWIRFLAWPMLFLIILGAWARHGERPILYLVISVVSVLVYLPLMLWVSLFIGLRIRNQVRALFAAMAVILAWCFLPGLLFALLDTFVLSRVPVPEWLRLISPVRLVWLTMFDGLGQAFPKKEWAVVIGTFLVYGGLLYLARRLCFRNVDQSLGRI